MQTIFFNAQEKAGEVWTWSEHGWKSLFTKIVTISQQCRSDISHLFSLQIFLCAEHLSLGTSIAKRVLKAHGILPLLPDGHVKRHDLLNASSMPM